MIGKRKNEDGLSEPVKESGSALSPQAKRSENDWQPAAWAFGVLLVTFLIATVLNWTGKRPSVQMELLSNIMMFAVAVNGFFALGQPSKLSVMRLRVTLSNLTVSVLAFLMNIKVFGYILRRDFLLDDLWSWHTWWILCAGVQMLFLSGFAQYTLRLARKAASAIVKTVKQSDKGILVIFLMSAVLWGTFLGCQISARGIQAVFSDVKILWGSVLLLLVSAMTGILLYVVPAVCRKSRRTVFGMNGKKIVITIGIAAAATAAVLIFAFLAMLGGERAVFTVLAAMAVLSGLLYAAVRNSFKKSVPRDAAEKDTQKSSTLDQDNQDRSSPEQNPPEQNSPEQNPPEQGTPNQSGPSQDRPTAGRKLEWVDVLVTLIAYIVIPITLVCSMRALSDKMPQYLTTLQQSLATWQQFLKTIDGMLQWAGNGPQI